MRRTPLPRRIAVNGVDSTPFRFAGTLHKVTVDLSGQTIPDPNVELSFTWLASKGDKQCEVQAEWCSPQRCC
jgi:hypothetical protein